MKYLNLFEENENPYWLLLIYVDCALEYYELYKEEEDANNSLINTIHHMFAEYEDEDYDKEISDYTDVQELLEYVDKSPLFYNYDIYINYINCRDKVELNPNIKTKNDAKRFNI